MPLGDIQLDPRVRRRPRQVDLKRLKHTIQWGVDHNAYWTGMGDYVDIASPSNRAVLRGARLYENLTFAMQDKADETDDELRELLAPTVGRWLGLVTGHHRWDYADGSTTDTRLAEYLETDFLGDQGFNVLRVGEYNNRAPALLKILTLHGQGGGGLLGASLSKLDKFRTPYPADIVLMGHYHVAGATKRPLFDIRGGERGGAPRLVSKEQIIGVTGAYLRGHMQDSKNPAGHAEGGYAEVGMMSPLALGGLVVFIRPKMTHNGFAQADLDHMSI